MSTQAGAQQSVSRPKPVVRPKIFGHLMSEVIRKGLCVSCGACVAVCPVESIAMTDGTPSLAGLCVACGMCYKNCPQIEFDVGAMEKLVFGRERTEEEAETGVLKACYAVRATDDDTLKKCQDGGAVTAILSQFLADGGECAVVAGLEEGEVWSPIPVVAISKEDVLGGAGTKYTPCPALLGIDSAVSEYMKSKIAAVGTPCQMRALTRIKTGDYSDVKITESVDLNIGLFCMETFGYSSFMEFLEKEGVDASKVDKFDIKKGRFIAWQNGEAIFDVELSRVKELVRPCCGMCDDFSAEFSDLSVGNVGSPNGWSTVIVRTDRGEEALRAAEKGGLVEVKPIEEVKPGLKLVIRLSKLKKEESTQRV